jgi:hypothetical protein
MFSDQALCLDVDDELGAFTYLAFDMNGASHLLNDLLADRESKASALLVSLGVLIELIEVYEQLADTLLRHSYARVYHTHLNIDVVLQTLIQFFRQNI